jgi:NarL family two-component system response regulator LiaR
MSREAQKTRIVIADDHHMVRQGIRQLLEREPDFDVVGETDNGLEAVKLARELMPHVVVIEARLTGLSSAETTKRIKTELPDTAVLILSSLEDQDYIVGLLGAGANGYMLKSAKGEELVQAIRFVKSGEFVSHPLIAQKIFKRMRRIPVTLDFGEHLTAREAEVLRLAAKGKNNRDIAAELSVGVRTVKGHLMSIFDKMHVNSRTEAVIEALKRGWITIEGD